jgi:hypothetical protein
MTTLISSGCLNPGQSEPPPKPAAARIAAGCLRPSRRAVRRQRRQQAATRKQPAQAP